VPVPYKYHYQRLDVEHYSVVFQEDPGMDISYLPYERKGGERNAPTVR
jgi:hypothetical protein